jgi:GntR family carbon starvation induced transcriptional regulator
LLRQKEICVTDVQTDKPEFSDMSHATNPAIGRTQASLLTDAIRSDILSGKLPPGQKLKFKDMSLRYSCGVIPLREALSRLATTGFVDAEDQRGFRVAPISREEVVDLTQVRRRIEQDTLREAMIHADDAYRARVAMALERLDGFAMTDGAPTHMNPDWDAAHEAFHEALMSACPSAWQLRLFRMLRDQSARYHHLSLRDSRRVSRDAHREHHDIAAAVIAGKTDLACALLAEHSSITAEIVMDQLFD